MAGNVPTSSGKKTEKQWRPCRNEVLCFLFPRRGHMFMLNRSGDIKVLALLFTQMPPLASIFSSVFNTLQMP